MNFCVRMFTEQVSQDKMKKDKSLRFYRPKFSYIFCDMDGKNFGSFFIFFFLNLSLFYIYPCFPCLEIRHTLEQSKSDYGNDSSGFERGSI